MYGILAATATLGVLIGRATFRHARSNAFDLESRELSDTRAEPRAAGVLQQED